jgi:hypothetical protein
MNFVFKNHLKLPLKKSFFPIGEEIWSYEKLAFIEN